MYTDVANLVRDVEVKELKNGKVKGKTAIAVNKKVRTKDGVKKTTLFWDVEFTPNIMEAFQNKLKKGTQITFWGDWVKYEWKDEEGKPKSKTVLKIFRMVPTNCK